MGVCTCSIRVLLFRYKVHVSLLSRLWNGAIYLPRSLPGLGAGALKRVLIAPLKSVIAT